MRVVAYTRVSTREQAEDGHGLDAQRSQLTAQAAARGWEIVRLCQDEGLSGASLKGRNGLVEAIQLIESGEADVLMVTKIDRVSRSAGDFAGLIRRAKDNGWVLVVLDIGLDLTTTTGKLVAQIMAAVAEFERDVIADRTKDGLAAAREKGKQLGGPALIHDTVTERITTLHGEGATLMDIAERLNEDGVPTARGGKRWYASTVRGVLQRVARQNAAAAAVA